MKINPSVFKAYDIRGLYPQDINEDIASAIVKAIYSFFVTDIGKNPLTVILGRDMRISSPSIFERVKQALTDLGAQVIDVGLVSTPTFYFSIFHYQADCGIQISASHNPKDYTGMKFAKRVGDTLVKIGKATGMDLVKNRAFADDFLSDAPGGNVVTKTDALDEELKAAFDFVKPQSIASGIVIADAANAMGSLFLDALFKTMPQVQLVRMNFQLDGTFPAHQPDPLQFKLLADLQKRVLSEKANLGIAPDGDGDRVFFIDEKGSIIPATYISALLAHEILLKHPKEKIIVDIRYVRNVANVVAKYGGSLSVSKVGHALITEQLNREGAFFAGESSGHYYFRSTGGAESSLRVILMLLDIIGREKKPISEILTQYISSIESGEVNFKLPKELTGASIVEMLKKQYSSGTVSTLDGIAIDYPDWRFSVRTSNTEPLLRLNLEGISNEIVQQYLTEIKSFLIERGAAVVE